MVVEHDMGFIRAISEIVTVLCDGAVLAPGHAGRSANQPTNSDRGVPWPLTTAQTPCTLSPGRGQG